MPEPTNGAAPAANGARSEPAALGGVNGQANGAGGDGPVTADQLKLLADLLARNQAFSLSQWGLRGGALSNLLDGGVRDLEGECHYPAGGGNSIPPDFYRDLFDREAVANKVVQALPKECWQVTPAVFETEDAAEVTPFEQAWDDLGRGLGGGGGTSWHQDEVGSPVWDALLRADVLSGIGHYGIVLLGIDDGKNLQDPVEGVEVLVNERVRGPDGVTRNVTAVLPDSPAPPGLGAAAASTGMSFNAGPLFGGRDYGGKQDWTRDPNWPDALADNCWWDRADEVMVHSEAGNVVVNRHSGALNPQSLPVVNQWRAGQEPTENAPKAVPPNKAGGVPGSPFLQGTDAAYGNLPWQQGMGQPPTGAGSDRPNPQGGVYGNPNGLGTATPAGAGPSGTDQQYFGVQFGPSERLGGPPPKAERRLLFLRVFSEDLVQIVRYEWNVRNPRFGLPVMYRVTLNDPRESYGGVGLPLATVYVHWSRVVHVADNRMSSQVLGVPRMRPVLNRLLDLRKIYAASGEGFWKSSFPILSLETHPQLGGDPIIDQKGLRAMLSDLYNGMQRDMILSGMAAKTLPPQVTDPTPYVNVQLEAIGIQLGMPVRVLKGSERGELASTQDDASWNDRLKHRQHLYLTPALVCPFIDRLIQVGVLPEPGKGLKGKGKPAGQPTRKYAEGEDQAGTPSGTSYATANGRVSNYDPDEPRDEGGRWTAGAVQDLKVYTGGTGKEGKYVTYYTTSKSAAESYKTMHEERFGPGAAVHERQLVIRNPAPWHVVEAEAGKVGIDNEGYTEGSVFDNNLHDDAGVGRLVSALKNKGYDGAVLSDVPYGGEEGEIQAYITFTGARGLGPAPKAPAPAPAPKAAPAPPKIPKGTDPKAAKEIKSLRKDVAELQEALRRGILSNPQALHSRQERLKELEGKLAHNEERRRYGRGWLVSNAANGKPVAYEADGGYSVEWPDLDSNTDKDKAAIALSKIQAVAAYIQAGAEAILPVEHFFTKVLGWDEEEAKAMIEAAHEAHGTDGEGPMTVPPAGEQGHPATPPLPPPPPVLKPGQLPPLAGAAATKTPTPPGGKGGGVASIKGPEVKPAAATPVKAAQVTEAKVAGAGKPTKNVAKWDDWATLTENYSPDQPREPDGRWGDGGTDGGEGGTKGGPSGAQAGLTAEPTTPPPPGRALDPDVTADPNGDGVTDAARVGVPAMSVPPPPPIPQVPNLTEHERAVETDFRDAYHADPDGLAGAYRDLALATAPAGEPPTFATDDAKVLSAAWSDPNMSQEERAQNRATLNVALHQTANAIAKRAFLEHLDTLKPGDQVLVTVGGCGAGKGFALKNVAEALALKQGSKAVWDSAGDQNATENPWVQKECEARGLKAAYVYVHADPQKQWADPARGVVKRAADPADGRMVDAKVFADSYALGAANHQAFYEANKGNPSATFAFLDNTGAPKQVAGIPAEAHGHDRHALADFAARAAQTSGAPPHVVRGATAGKRIWKD